jgi:hypothetical protein
MLKIMRGERRIIVGAHVSNVASSMLTNIPSYDPGLTMAFNSTLLIFTSLKLCQRASLYSSSLPPVQGGSHER